MTGLLAGPRVDDQHMIEQLARPHGRHQRRADLASGDMSQGGIQDRRLATAGDGAERRRGSTHAMHGAHSTTGSTRHRQRSDDQLVAPEFDAQARDPSPVRGPREALATDHVGPEEDPTTTSPLGLRRRMPAGSRLLRKTVERAARRAGPTDLADNTAIGKASSCWAPDLDAMRRWAEVDRGQRRIEAAVAASLPQPRRRLRRIGR